MVIERLTNEDVLLAIDDLVDQVGVREDTALDYFSSIMRSQGRKACAQVVAEHLGLPVRVSLTDVGSGAGAPQTERFGTSALTPVEQRGSAGVFAQVSIPPDLPSYGTPRLRGYVIPVRVSAKDEVTTETFVAVIAHELSHVLLSSLLHPKKDSELHVDLVPLLLGFRTITREGRKSVRKSSTTSLDGSTVKTTTTTTSTTYGYLPDIQFDFACQHIAEMVERHVHEKRQVLLLASQLHRLLRAAVAEKERFYGYRERLDSHRPRRMSEANARRMAALHAPNYAQNWEGALSQSRTALGSTEEGVRRIDHYWPDTRGKLDSYSKALRSAITRVSGTLEGIKADVAFMRRYVGFWFRLRDTRRRG